MSGTSLDGVDGVLVEFDRRSARRSRVRAHAHRPFDATLRDELLALNAPGADELHRAALAGNALARVYARRRRRSAGDAPASAPAAVRAIGAHGQTVRHRPARVRRHRLHAAVAQRRRCWPS